MWKCHNVSRLTKFVKQLKKNVKKFMRFSTSENECRIILFDKQGYLISIKCISSSSSLDRHVVKCTKQWVSERGSESECTMTKYTYFHITGKSNQHSRLTTAMAIDMNNNPVLYDTK